MGGLSSIIINLDTYNFTEEDKKYIIASSHKKLSLRERRNMKPLKISISDEYDNINSCDFDNSNVQKKSNIDFNNFFNLESKQ